ncbi:glycosyltransferase family 2 protein [Trueperella pyogenes]|uniref:Glycosyltransferase family 2 protein n=1 Tax=Trueperella pyogenes TaxID=1661 RepID=A0ABV3NCJ9_9ACTO
MISVVIAARADSTRHGTSRLRLVLDSLERQTVADDCYEVIVVDDHSDPPLADAIAARSLPISVLCPDKTGMVCAFNFGIEHAKGDLVLLGLDDEILSPGALQAHMIAYEGNGRHIGVGRARLYPSIAAQNDIYVDPLLRDGFLRETFDQIWDASVVDRRIWEFESVLASPSFPRLASSYLGMRFGNHTIPMSFFERYGLLDEKLQRYGGWNVDIDLGLRIQSSDYEFCLVSEARSINLPHPRHQLSIREAFGAWSYLIRKHGCIELLPMMSYFDGDYSIADIEESIQCMRTELECARA